jgi:hypothetical protein
LIQVILASIIRSNRHFLGGSCSSKLCSWERGCPGQGRATGQGRPCLARVSRWFQFLQKYVPAHENHNTTRGTLLVLKMCMKLVIYSSRTRGFDGRIFVVRTVNKLPQAKRLLVLEQSLDSASADQELHDVIARQVPVHKLHALLAILNRLVREKLSLTLPMGLVAFHLSFEG